MTPLTLVVGRGEGCAQAADAANTMIVVPCRRRIRAFAAAPTAWTMKAALAKARVFEEERRGPRPGRLSRPLTLFGCCECRRADRRLGRRGPLLCRIRSFR